MSSSIWARVARTAFIRPRFGSGPALGRAYVLLSAKPTTNVLLRPIPLITRQQSAFAALRQDIASEPPTEDILESTEEEAPRFSSLEGVLHGGVYRALTQAPFQLTTMSPVQAAVLPLLPELAQPYDPENPTQRDLMVKAKTGTGKTLAFLIPAVEARIKVLEAESKKAIQNAGVKAGKNLGASTERQFAKRHTGIVIISPTRELATQICTEAQKLVEHVRGMEVHLFVGGSSKREQLRGFKFGRNDIVVATPGRLNDLLESPEVSDSIAHTQTFILDEADTLLDMGFMPDIQNILKYLPPSPQRQTFLFSATLSPAIRKIASESLSADHKYINCVSDDAPPTHANIKQYHTVLPSAEHQFSHVLRVLAHDQLANPGKSKTVVFFPTTKMTRLFAELLQATKKDTLPAGANTSVYELHSLKAQAYRIRASDAFRTDKSGASVLITSDVSARGVDYPGVTRVVQVGVPKSGEIYIHRVGRTGRAGTKGRGDLIILPWEQKFLSTQMRALKLDPQTVEEQREELMELAKNYDKDPTGFWGGEIPMVKPRRDVGGATFVKSRTLFRSMTSLAPTIEDIPRVVAETIAQGDHQAFNDTFASLVGYYVGLTDSLRLRRLEILEECKKWATEACGIPSPRISESMMEKMGLAAEKRKMNDIRKGGFRKPVQNSWMGRGKIKSRESRDDEGDSWERRDRRGGDGFSSRGSRGGDGFNSRGSRSGGGGFRSEGFRSGGDGFRREGSGSFGGAFGRRSGGRDY